MPKKILLVDDEPEIVEICRDYLKASGYDVVTAKDGAQGLSSARREKPDLVVMDVMMPEMDGYATYQSLREDPATCHIPVILLTAKTQAADRRRFVELKVAGVITKPFDPLTLADQVATVLEHAHNAL